MVGHPTHKERDNGSHHDSKGLIGLKPAPLFYLVVDSFITKGDDEERQKKAHQEAANETGQVNLFA